MKKHQTAILLILSMLFTSWTGTQAKSVKHNVNIKAVGLFKDMAVVNINNQQYTLRVGQNNQPDIQLLSSNSEFAEVVYQNTIYQVSLTDTSSMQLAGLHKVDARAHLVSTGGLYKVAGSINDQLVDFVVDTGASYLTMSGQQADKLHISYLGGKQIEMMTANGNTKAYVVTLNKVRIGGIEMNNIEAAIIPDDRTPKVLLGMSFLKHVDIEQKGNNLVLKARVN